MRLPDPADKRVLVVDDDLASRRLIVKILERRGFKCGSAASAEEAQGLLQAKTYALLITDMRMWGEEGLDLIRFTTEEYPTMGAIMVSGLSDGALEAQALQAGASSFLGKPFNEEELLEKVDAALEKREEVIKLKKHLDH